MTEKTPLICQLVHGLPVGGTEVLVDRLIRRLSERFRFVIACLDEIGELGDILRHDGFEVLLLSRRPGFDWNAVRRIATLIHERRVTLIHAHQYTPFAYAAAARLFRTRGKLLFTEHGRFYPDQVSRKRRLFNRCMIRREDRMVAVGKTVRSALVDLEGLPPDRIDVVYNGVDLSRIDSDRSHRQAVRAELSVTNDEFLVLQVARLDRIKDHATAIRAIAAAAQHNHRLRLMIVGEGPERQTIERLVARHGLERRIVLLGQRRDIPRLLEAADAFLLSSVSEGIPVTVIEAMAAGVPVVATAVGGVPELVVDGETGLLAPRGDDQKLSECLLRLATDGQLRDRIRRDARLRIESNFSEDRMVQSYHQLYEEMLSARRSTSRERSLASSQ
jgi:sugar transferase (PEP-CTERM/EpsH1 system associated)